MKITTLTLTDNQAKIIFEETTPYFINSIRRTLLADIPKLAIENITVYDNTSALFDEIISHRLALIPLPTHLDLLGYRETCKCLGEGCPNCTVRYTLSKEGECTVYSKDLKAEDPMWQVKDEKIPIVNLLKGQRLILEAEANLGTGEKHVKCQTVVGIGYKYFPEINIDKNCNGCGECVKACPRNILKMRKDKLIIENIENCTLCKACVESCEKHAVHVQGNPNKILLTYETDESLTVRKALLVALQILSEKYSSLEKKIKDTL